MLLTWLGVGDEYEQQRKGECLILTLAHTACREHLAHELYSLVKTSDWLIWIATGTPDFASQISFYFLEAK